MFGGRFTDIRNFPDGHEIHTLNKEEYLNSIKVISSTIDSVLDFSPTIISGPKFNPAFEHTVFRNKDRRLYILRISDNPDFIKNFNPGEIDTLSKDWKPGKWGLPI